ncbi:hypothetical protein F4782DRAFT_530260 [Xylaria castorea]|nr:hypothetical protein F4782DRAFT_530260 [Xylaria castorea]
MNLTEYPLKNGEFTIADDDGPPERSEGPSDVQRRPSEVGRQYMFWPGIESYVASGCDQDNATLRDRPKVKQFFQEVEDHKSLADSKTLSWLSKMPWRLFNEAIPLFEDDDGLEEYRLRPSPCRLRMSNTVIDHFPGVIGISASDSTNDQRVEVHLGDSVGARIVMAIGQLCVHLRGGREESYWTGYDVFVDYDLSLWMIFNNYIHSDLHSPAPKYHFPCKLTEGDPSNMKCPNFEFAHFCSSLHEIESTTLEEAVKLVEECYGSLSRGRIEFDQISTKEMNCILLRQELMNIVVMDRADPYKFWELQLRYPPSMVKENITEEVLRRAAANQYCGLSMMELLLRGYGPLRETIENSPNVVTAAAANTEFGAKLVEMLERGHLGEEDDKRRVLPISKLATIKALLNEEQGLDILIFFYHSQLHVCIRHMVAIFEEECTPDEEEERELIAEAHRRLNVRLRDISPFSRNHKKRKCIAYGGDQ